MNPRKYVLFNQKEKNLHQSQKNRKALKEESIDQTIKKQSSQTHPHVNKCRHRQHTHTHITESVNS